MQTCNNAGCTNAVREGFIKYCSVACRTTATRQKMREWREKRAREEAMEIAANVPAAIRKGFKVEGLDCKLFRRDLVSNRNPIGSIYAEAIVRAVDNGVNQESRHDFTKDVLESDFPDIE